MRNGPPGSGGEQGFTLIELIISLGLFALIAVAGLAMVDGILRVQGGTEAKLDRLAAFQRTVAVVTSDLDQIAAGRVAGEGPALSFTRSAPGAGGPPLEVRYLLAGGALVRQAGLMPQPLLDGASEARWRFRGDSGWVEKWPASAEEADRRPRAIALEMRTPEGLLRRVVVLPSRAEDLAGPNAGGPR
ncbi:type II secretion system protein GspJ [Sphingomonas canadensis]|uniref:Type II secretion system protein J n=1 Tax=Sphingomonas canadensis TaxID=1219257 RepID=A0ABW3H2U1_9SPHN|nr:type II secretion system protein GspJ [Sphingomonas canadensis]MCW3835752.1 prepilin-type N-terminal cleavage/methylation domain-containing protein [Sphingomonas canadensis]